MEALPEVQIALEGEWEGAGVLQISDALSLDAVMKMTGLSIAHEIQSDFENCAPVCSGERFILQIVNGEIRGYSRGWMTAAQRVSIGVPLHPDRMSKEDWDSLPGVGERLAAAIEADRQINGDYCDIRSLTRVKGIGPGRVKLWEPFF